MQQPERGLRPFVRESNWIENIVREPSTVELVAHEHLLSLDALSVEAIAQFVQTVADAPLRALPGMNVRVGSHRPPPGGPEIPRRLEGLLRELNVPPLDGGHTPFEAHVHYERLHPFMDGNGRSGRAIWLWQMLRDGRDPYALSFLRRWYYDSLEASRV